MPQRSQTSDEKPNAWPPDLGLRVTAVSLFCTKHSSVQIRFEVASVAEVGSAAATRRTTTRSIFIPIQTRTRMTSPMRSRWGPDTPPCGRRRHPRGNRQKAGDRRGVCVPCPEGDLSPQCLGAPVRTQAPEKTRHSVSSPHKGRVLRFPPLPAVSARITTVNTLRDDPFKSHCAGVGEHKRSLVNDSVAEHEAVDADDEG